MQHLVFDIGGVFYRGWPDEAFWGRWTERTGLTKAAIVGVLASSPEHREAQLGRLAPDEAFRRAGERLGVDGPTLRALAFEAYVSDFNQPLADAVRVLRAEGVPVSALTNSLSTEAELRARPEFAGLFDHIVSSCDVGLVKPDAAIFRALLDRIGAKPAQVVFVDDLAGHVEAAQALGFMGLRFRTTEQALADLARLYPVTSLSSRL